MWITTRPDPIIDRTFYVQKVSAEIGGSAEKNCLSASPEFRCRVTYNPNDYFSNSSSRFYIAAKIDAKILQNLKIHVEEVWRKIAGHFLRNTAKRYFGNLATFSSIL